MIQERLKEPPRVTHREDEDETVTRRRKRIAFLDLLLEMHREDASFTLKDIREEVDTFMFEVYQSLCLHWGGCQTKSIPTKVRR